MIEGVCEIARSGDGWSVEESGEIMRSAEMEKCTKIVQEKNGECGDAGFRMGRFQAWIATHSLNGHTPLGEGLGVDFEGLFEGLWGSDEHPPPPLWASVDKAQARPHPPPNPSGQKAGPLGSVRGTGGSFHATTVNLNPPPAAGIGRGGGGLHQLVVMMRRVTHDEDDGDDEDKTMGGGGGNHQKNRRILKRHFRRV